MIPWTIVRYVSRVSLISLLWVTGGTLSLTLFFECFEILKKTFLRSDIPFIRVLELSILKSADHFQNLLPFLVFLGCLLAFWRLNRHREIVVLKTMGISSNHMVMGLTALMIVIGGVYITVLNPVIAAMQSRLVHVEERFFQKKTYSLSWLPSGLWIREKRDQKTYFIHAQVCNLSKGTFQGVTFYTLPHAEKTLSPQRFWAEKADLKPGFWTLYNVRESEGGKPTTFLKILTLPTLFSPKKLQNAYAPPQTLSFLGLYRFLQDMQNSGIPLREHKLHWHGEWARIGFMISMAVLALGLSWRHSRYTPATVLIALGALISLILHFLRNVVFAMGISGQLPLFLACWALPLGTFFIGMSLLSRRT